jgi:hypothetical protein
MMRKYNDFTFPDWFFHCKSGDIPMLLLLSLRGSIGFLDQIMAVYRIHDHGISTTHRSYKKIVAMIYILEQFNIYTGHRFRDAIEASMIREIDLHYPHRDGQQSGKAELNESKKAKTLRFPYNLFRR